MDNPNVHRKLLKGGAEAYTELADARAAKVERGATQNQGGKSPDSAALASLLICLQC
jgi:hypothetical protein